MPYTFNLLYKSLACMHIHIYMLHVFIQHGIFKSVKISGLVLITLQVMRKTLLTEQWWLYKINIQLSVKNTSICHLNINMTRFLRKRFKPLILHFPASFSAVHRFQWHERLSSVPGSPSVPAQPLSSGGRSSSPIHARSFHCHQSVYHHVHK